MYDFNTTTFPTMQVGVDVYNEDGAIIPGLKAEQVVVLEDEQARPLLAWNELQPGVRFVLALNLGPEFARRDERGLSRYAKITASLLHWAESTVKSGQDDLYLVTNSKTGDTHLETSQDFSAFFTSFQPPLQQLTPTLDTLARALTVANDPLPQAGMKRLVLFVTSLPASATEIAALQNLTDQAVGMGIRVHVWIVGSMAYFTTSGATALKDLAIQTGGQFALFSGQEPLPDVEDYLAPLRRTYSLQYASGITTSGNHTLSVSISHQGKTYLTPPLHFNLNVQPPNAFLVSLPTQIIRRCLQEERCETSQLTPSTQELEILVEFPDGHPRPLIRTVLYVDGQIADQNTEKPWNTFQWDLSSYTTTAQHLLQVEAVDSLGLSQISATLPITVVVAQSPTGWFREHLSWIVGGIVLVAGLLLVGILSGARPDRLLFRRARTATADVLTQPVIPARTSPLAPRPASRHALAFLVRVDESGQPLTAKPLPLTRTTTLGSDPLRADIVLDDPSVSPLHARITQEKDGHFYIHDTESTAGTWVNFEPVEQPHRLCHNDVIQIGRYSYRFTLPHPPPPKLPRFFPRHP